MAEIKNVILIAVSLMVIAVIFPIALGLIGIAGDYVITPFNATGQNESAVLLSDVVSPALITLLTVLIPIIAIISIVMYFLPKMKAK